MISIEQIFTFGDSSQLQTLLSQPTPNLQEILDQDNIAQEVKECNDDLIAYLIKPENFTQLVSYVSELPPVDLKLFNQANNDNKLSKFPFVSCEILSAGNETLLQQFFMSNSPTDTTSPSTEAEEPEQITSLTQVDKDMPIIKFLGFLDAPAPIDLTLAGYFSKVFKLIFQQYPHELSEILFSSSCKYLKQMMTHIYADSIQELFLAVVKLDSSYFRKAPSEHHVIQRVGIVEHLIATLFQESPSNELYDLHSDQQSNCSLTLRLMLNNASCFLDSKNVIAPLLTPDTLTKIIQGLQNPRLVKSLSLLVQQLCGYYRDVYSPKGTLTKLDLTTYSENVGKPEIPDNEPFLLAAMDSLKDIFGFLRGDKGQTQLQPKQNQDVVNNELNPNQRKISLCEVIFNFLKLQNLKLDEKIIETEGLPTLLELFIKNPWNNILHSLLTKLLTFILEHGSPTLRQALFEQAKILDVIINESNELNVPYHQGTGNKTKKSFFAYFNIIANTINKSTDAFIVDFCTNHKNWTDFKAGTLKLENDMNKGVIESEGWKVTEWTFDSLNRSNNGNKTFKRSPTDEPEGSKAKFVFSPKEDGESGLGLLDMDDDGNNDEPDKTPKGSRKTHWSGF